MTNATKTLFIIFISLVTLTALVKWTSGTGASEAFRSKLVDVDPEQINKIRIEKPIENQTLVLEETPSGWTVAVDGSGESYEADQNIVQRVLDQLTDMSVQAVVTRNPAKFTRYKADSTGTVVSLYDGDALLSNIIIGASHFVSQTDFNNYVRPAEEKTVYTIEGLLESAVNRELDDWRDKQVWDLDRDAITRVDFLFPADSSYSIGRTDDQTWISEQDTLESSQVNTILRRLSSPRASGFVDSLSTSSFGTELYAIQFREDNGQQRTIRLRPVDDDESRYIAVATDFPYVFTLNRSTWDNSVFKSRDELLK